MKTLGSISYGEHQDHSLFEMLKGSHDVDTITSMQKEANTVLATLF